MINKKFACSIQSLKCISDNYCLLFVKCLLSVYFECMPFYRSDYNHGESHIT